MSMLGRTVRTFATSALRMAETASQVEASNAYGIQVSKAQGHVNGLVGGMLSVLPHLSRPLPLHVATTFNALYTLLFIPVRNLP